jgi:acetolactate synthase-1/2/3 large subunit
MTGPAQSRGGLVAEPAPFADAVAEGLRRAGVRRLFGVPGGASLDLIGAAATLGIGFTLAHTESAACIMASTFGLLTGAAGAAVVTRGPGLTSAANGLAQATLDRFPLLLLADGVPQAEAHRSAHQRLDQVRMAAPLAKHSGVLGWQEPSLTVAAAAALACCPPAGAVHLTLDPSVPGGRVEAARTDAATADPGNDDVLAVLAGARHPVVIVGLDAVDAAEPLRSALAGTGCPVFTTYQAKGVVGDSWDGHAGLFTGAAIEADLLRRADLIVGLGLDPVEPMPGPWPYRADVVLLHRHPIETGYFGERTRLLTGEYGTGLLPLLGHLHSDWPPGTGAKVRVAGRQALEDGAAGFRPQDVIHTVREVAGDVTVTVDAGAHMLVAMPLWSTEYPRQVLISNGLATMGFALPAAVGAALARPSDKVVCLVGDGGLGMVLAELETLARLDLDVMVVVFNDATLTLIELKQPPGADPGAVAYRSTDFAAAARAMGVPAAVATNPGQLRAQVAGAHRGPFLVDARIERSSYRHVMQAIRGGQPQTP